MKRPFVRGILAGIVLALFGALAHAQTAPSPSAPAAAPAGSAVNGKKLYESVGCWQCHGFSAQGGQAGPRIGPESIALPAFIRYVRQPTRSMPPYTAKVLKDSDLADIHAYLKTVPKPLDPVSIPLLKSVN
jgi:mono/diheme cytochrome c family protein